MVTVKKLYVFSACVLSLSAVFFTTFAISTNHWVYSDTASLNGIEFTNGKPVIKYGLFAGTFKRTWGVEGTMPIYMTCLIKENVCAYLCANSPVARYDLLRDLYNNINVTEPTCVTVGLRSQNFHPSVTTRNLEAENTNKKFINCGVWVSTIFFLIISMLFGSLASSLSMYNTLSNPVKTYCSIYGIYISNGVALFTVILAMLLWGIEYHKSIFHDMAVYYTLVGQVNSDKTAQLGYSYWLILCSIVLHIASIGVLYIRHYLVSKDPGQQIVERDESGDPVIYLY